MLLGGPSYDALDKYATNVLLNGLNKTDPATGLKAKFLRPYHSRQAYFGSLVDDTLVSYATNIWLGGLNGGDNWTTAYVTHLGPSHISIVGIPASGCGFLYSGTNYFYPTNFFTYAGAINTNSYIVINTPTILIQYTDTHTYLWTTNVNPTVSTAAGVPPTYTVTSMGIDPYGRASPISVATTTAADCTTSQVP